jgi:PKD repeat protein
VQLSWRPLLFLSVAWPSDHAAAGEAPAVPLDADAWTIVAVTSEQRGSEARLAFDGDPATYWHSVHGNSMRLPQSLTIDLGASQTLCGLIYLPRPDGGNGTIAEFDLHGSADGERWGEALASGRFTERRGANEIRFPTAHGVRYVRLTARSAMNKSPHWASVAELTLLTPTTERPQVDFFLPVRCARAGRPVRFEDRTRIGPASWKWSFPGGTPSMSTERHPEVTYLHPGSYAVTLEAANANGVSSVTREQFIEVTPEGPMALWLDGRDNELLIGMGLIDPPWTVELWVCGDDDPWRPREVLLGAGQYAAIERIDPTPLVLERGVPVSPKAGVRASSALDPGWHHLALTCDGRETALFVNGREAARSASAHPLLPGALGNHANSSTAFGGALDELRIWRAALDESTIAAWSVREPCAAHPQRSALAAWWSFDTMDAEIAPNLVSNPPLYFHIRNGRLNFRGTAPLAIPVAQEHPPLREAWRSGAAQSAGGRCLAQRMARRGGQGRCPAVQTAPCSLRAGEDRRTHRNHSRRCERRFAGVGRASR